MQYKDLAVNPVSVVLQLVGAKWKILVIKELLKKEMRFVELKKHLGCTAKVLTNCLKELEEDGLVVREILLCVLPDGHHGSDVAYRHRLTA